MEVNPALALPVGDELAFSSEEEVSQVRVEPSRQVECGLITEQAVGVR